VTVDQRESARYAVELAERIISALPKDHDLHV